MAATTVPQTWSPGVVTGLPAVVEIATGSHAMARAADGSVWS